MSDRYGSEVYNWHWIPINIAFIVAYADLENEHLPALLIWNKTLFWTANSQDARLDTTQTTSITTNTKNISK